MTTLTLEQWRRACSADDEGNGTCPYRSWEPAPATVQAGAGGVEFDCLHGCEQATVAEWLQGQSHLLNGASAATPARDGGMAPRAADLERVRPFRWAWENRLLVGYLNLLVGDEGVGKGTFLAWLIARLTQGDLPGSFRGRKARVLIVGDEDGFDGVWVPRMLAAGVDLACVFDLPIGDDGALDLKRDQDDFRGMLIKHEIDVVVFDQFLDNLGVSVDDWRAKQVREAVGPLRRTAADLDIVPIASLHTNKGRTGSFRERVSGTQAFNALSRSSLLLGEHPDDAERRVLVRGKGNYSKIPASIEFSIESSTVEVNGYRIPVGVVADVQAGELTIGEVLGEPAKGLTKADEGRRLLAAELEDGEWHQASELLSLLAEAGIADREARRLATDVGVERKKSSGFPTHALWRLPRAPARGGTPVYPSSRSSHSGDARPARPATPVDRQDEHEVAALASSTRPDAETCCNCGAALTMFGGKLTCIGCAANGRVAA